MNIAQTLDPAAEAASRRYMPVLLLMFGVMVFLVGLVSEQISSLRFENRR